ncbi:MAG: lactate utilization protein [bacterium]
MKTSNKDFKPIKNWFDKRIINTVIEALRKRAFNAKVYKDIASVNRYLLKTIPRSATIGIPGSVTIRGLGIIEKLRKRGNKIFQHWYSELTENTDRDARRLEGTADFYLTSTNAITTDGDIINIDGIGNRVAAMIYGPKNVIIIAGINKIVRSIDEGIKRSKNIAGVMNAKRVGAETPCVKTGICIDCKTKRRICRVISIIQYRPWQTNISVILITENLGF